MSASQQPRIRLYVAGASPKSCRAIRALHAWLSRLHMEESHADVIDVYRDPSAAIENNIVAVPALIIGDRQIVGTSLLREAEPHA